MNEIADDLVIKGMRRFFKNLKEPGHRVKALFQRHHLDSDKSDTHKNQFLRSMNVLRDAPGTKGLKFPDGSYSQNLECEDMDKSIPLDDTDFQFVH